LPVIEALAEEFEGRATFIIVDADEDGEVLAHFGAGSLPTYVVFKDREQVDNLTINFIATFLESRLRGMIEGALGAP